MGVRRDGSTARPELDAAPIKVLRRSVESAGPSGASGWQIVMPAVHPTDRDRRCLPKRHAYCSPEPLSSRGRDRGDAVGPLGGVRLTARTCGSRRGEQRECIAPDREDEEEVAQRPQPPPVKGDRTQDAVRRLDRTPSLFRLGLDQPLDIRTDVLADFAYLAIDAQLDPVHSFVEESLALIQVGRLLAKVEALVELDPKGYVDGRLRLHPSDVPFSLSDHCPVIGDEEHGRDRTEDERRPCPRLTRCHAGILRLRTAGPQAGATGTAGHPGGRTAAGRRTEATTDRSSVARAGDEVRRRVALDDVVADPFAIENQGRNQTEA